ncbi:MAG TPA: MarR family transcriptional regulator [Candidatus Krumholzibacteria bacterium]|nr:MarR family transcriptional regulator [Candidatus Krumholzibacteria bacterium]
MAKLQKEIKQKKPFRSRQQEAVLAIVRTADILKRRWRIVEEFGVTGQQYNVLRILRGAHPEALPTMEIASRMIENTPGITGLIDRLEEKGLVKRARDAEDRRCSRCTITEKGLALLSQMDPVADRNEEEALSMLDGKDIDRLIEILEVVRAHHS